MVGMHHGVDQCLAQGLMGRALAAAHLVGIQLEGQLDVGTQPLAHTLVELEQVGLPGAIGGDAVGPAHGRVGGQLLAVVDVVAGQAVAQGLEGAEHQQASHGDADPPTCALASHATQLEQQAGIVLRQPGVVRRAG